MELGKASLWLGIFTVALLYIVIFISLVRKLFQSCLKLRLSNKKRINNPSKHPSILSQVPLQRIFELTTLFESRQWDKLLTELDAECDQHGAQIFLAAKSHTDSEPLFLYFYREACAQTNQFDRINVLNKKLQIVASAEENRAARADILQRASLLIKNKRFEEAISILRPLLEDNINSEQKNFAVLHTSEALLHLKKYEESMTLLESHKWNSWVNKRAYCLAHMQFCYAVRHSGKLDRSIELMRALILPEECEDLRPAYSLQLSYSLLLKDNPVAFEEAEQLASLAAEKLPNYLFARTTRALILLFKGQVEEASKEIDFASTLEDSNTDSGILLLRALLFGLKNDRAQATGLFQAALEIDNTMLIIPLVRARLLEIWPDFGK